MPCSGPRLRRCFAPAPPGRRRPGSIQPLRCLRLRCGRRGAGSAAAVRTGSTAGTPGRAPGSGTGASAFATRCRDGRAVRPARPSRTATATAGSGFATAVASAGSGFATATAGSGFATATGAGADGSGAAATAAAAGAAGAAAWAGGARQRRDMQRRERGGLRPGLDRQRLHQHRPDRIGRAGGTRAAPSPPERLLHAHRAGRLAGGRIEAHRHADRAGDGKPGRGFGRGIWLGLGLALRLGLGGDFGGDLRSGLGLWLGLGSGSELRLRRASRVTRPRRPSVRCAWSRPARSSRSIRSRMRASRLPALLPPMTTATR